MKIGFIGAGRVGVSLGKYMQEKLPEEHVVSGYYSRNPQSARWAADYTGSACYKEREAVLKNSDVVFITVSDCMLPELAQLLAGEEVSGKCICHCSGAESSAIFESLKEKGAFCYSVHPLCAVSSKEFGYIALKEAAFTVEGDEKYLSVMHKLFEDMGNPTEIIRADRKVNYHLAAVFASNLVVGLYEMATQLLKECGFSDAFAEAALVSLFVNNTQNIAEKGTIQALTGPVERADVSTVEKHLQAASGSTKEIYRLLSVELMKIAQKKNTDRDYGQMQKLLEKVKE